MSRLVGTGWDRLLGAIAHPVRVAAWALATGVVVGPVGGLSWVLVAGLAAAGGVLGGELLGRSRLRTPVLVGGFALAAIGVALARYGLTTWALGPAVLGPAGALWISRLLGVGAAVGLGVGLLRALAARGPAVGAVELFALGGLLAGMVASHRDGAVARPLWLSDLAWSVGVDPGRVLLAGGAALTALLAGLLLLQADRRKPVLGWLLLPVLAMLAWVVAGALPTPSPPDPETLIGLLGDDEADAQAAGEAPDGLAGASGPGEGNQDEREDEREGEGAQGEDEREGEGAPGEGEPAGGADGEGTSAPPPPGDASDAEAPPPPEGTQQQAPDPLASGPASLGNPPVAVVLIDDDLLPTTGVWYLRQGQLSRFAGSRLVPSDLPGATADTLAHFPVAPTALPVPGPLPDRAPVRAPVHGTVSLLVDHAEPFAPEAPQQLGPRGNPNPARFVRSYSFVASTLVAPHTDLLGLPAGDPDWPEALRAELTQPPTDPRYRELAERLVADLPDDPVAQAGAIALWLGQNMTYTRSERHADTPDPTASFLFGNRTGYCVHSAHAAVYLWRSLGLPARIGTGYAVEEADRRGSTLLVRASDAHAWPELYLQGVGWVPLDVWPENTLDPEAAPLDEDEAAALGEMARAATALDEGPRPDRSWIPGVLARAALLGGLGLLALVLGAHWGLKLWRRAAPLWAHPSALPRVGYRVALDLLAEAGHQRAEGESREAFARRLGAQLPAVEPLTALHLRGALGVPGPADPARHRATWATLLLRLQVELAARTPRWRRLLGLLDPTSVHRVR